MKTRHYGRKTAANLTSEKICLFTAGGAFLSMLAISLLLCFAFGSLWPAAVGLLFTVIFGLWFLLFLALFQTKLADFSAQLCLLLDRMMDDYHKAPSKSSGSTDAFFFSGMCLEEETLYSRITHRLNRLYEMMYESRAAVALQRDGLQSLISDLAHQTRTPAANVKLICETLLTKSVTRREQLEFLSTAKAQADKLGFLIQAFVKTSRLENGIIEMGKELFPVRDTIVSAVNGILPRLDEKRMELTVDCPEELLLMHDRRWTTELLYNLLDNAVKYTPPSGRISVTVIAWEMYVKIEVTDSGRGIPEEEHAAIFRRFYREKAVHNTDGLGIGLYLAREIAAKQGGYIQVGSSPGHGSTFSVFLPYR